MSRSPADEALALVHQGWDHLRLQRPLAAWASWQRALRLKPEDPAASQALGVLTGAEDLPAAARAVYRFRPPRGEARRARWDARLRDRDLQDLSVAAETFGTLADEDPDDAPAWYNRALCLAWQGRNAPAVEALGRVVALEAGPAFDAAVEAWALAEVLRQGGGAEELADDLSHTLILTWPDDLGDPIAWLSGFAELRPLPSPLEPTTDRPAFPEALAFEWLSRPLPKPSPSLTADDLPRVLASIIATPGSLRFSSPIALRLVRVEDRLRERLGHRELPIERRSTPLPLALMDAAVGLFRLPPGLDDATRQRLTREAVEQFYEEDWPILPRLGLDCRRVRSRFGRFGPNGAVRDAARGDAVARAKLAGVIRVREQLGARPRAAALYAGYPFDRLRRRLGLDPIDPAAVDPADVSCMSGAELSRIDPARFDDTALAEAYRSAFPVCDRTVVRRLAAAMAGRDPSALVRNAPWMAQPVFFEVWRQGGRDLAREWMERAIALDETTHAGRHRALFESWRDALLSETGDTEEEPEGPAGSPGDDL
jgi:tetratricopeptide (TPR) repeat protein